MFSLDGTVKYWLYNGLSGIVSNGMCANLKDGDVYIFMNASRNMMKMLRQEEGGLVLYSIRLDIGRMKSAVQSSDEEVISSGISYEEMLGMVQSALDSPYVRRMKMLSKSL
jgi:transposase